MSNGNGEYAIDLHDVEKVYRGKVHALRGVEMQVDPGEIFGLLGPNGAGKSTLVKIMMTVVRASRAHGTMLGEPVGHKPTLARVGYLPEHHRFGRSSSTTRRWPRSTAPHDASGRRSCWRWSACPSGPASG
jgi:ABC-type multidrug transport system ATPase subunit